jgi:hypothetical protein
MGCRKRGRQVLMDNFARYREQEVLTDNLQDAGDSRDNPSI